MSRKDSVLQNPDFSFFSPCGNEVKMCVYVCVCVCVRERRWTVCVCSSLDVYAHLSMNESIECVCVYKFEHVL